MRTNFGFFYHNFRIFKRLATYYIIKYRRTAPSLQFFFFLTTYAVYVYVCGLCMRVRWWWRAAISQRRRVPEIGSSRERRKICRLNFRQQITDTHTHTRWSQRHARVSLRPRDGAAVDKEKSVLMEYKG